MAAQAGLCSLYPVVSGIHNAQDRLSHVKSLAVNTRRWLQAAKKAVHIQNSEIVTAKLVNGKPSCNFRSRPQTAAMGRYALDDWKPLRT